MRRFSDSSVIAVDDCSSPACAPSRTGQPDAQYSGSYSPDYVERVIRDVHRGHPAVDRRLSLAPFDDDVGRILLIRVSRRRPSTLGVVSVILSEKLSMWWSG